MEKAIEFVKKFGIARTKYWIKEFTEINKLPDEMINIEFMDDLKQIVEAFELVEDCGGIETVKKHLKNGNVFRFGETPLMKKAIELVEKCNASD